MKTKTERLAMRDDDSEPKQTVMKKKISQLLICTILCFCGLVASAQQKKVTGTVKDNSGLPVTNASVTVKGGSNGVATDGDGKFSINVNGPGAVLVISSINFKSKEVPVGQVDRYDIVLDAGGATQQE